MNLHSDFRQRAVVHAGKMPWVASPIVGVERVMLDRVGGEVARATSVVRYAPHSQFSRHVHGGGEEFFVLEGVFQDEHGDYPAGSYVRNPPQTAHTPGSDAGCVILVKLWQFDLTDRLQVRLREEDQTQGAPSSPEGVAFIPLHADDREEVRLEIWKPGASLRASRRAGGLELFVLEGDLQESGEAFTRHSWLRLPPDASLEATAGSAGVKLWVKAGHLEHVQHEAGPPLTTL